MAISASVFPTSKSLWVGDAVGEGDNTSSYLKAFLFFLDTLFLCFLFFLLSFSSSEKDDDEELEDHEEEDKELDVEEEDSTLYFLCTLEKQ